MSWVVLRQNRLGLLLWALLIAGFATYAGMAGAAAWDRIDHQGLWGCLAGASSAPQCGAAFTDFMQSFYRTDRLIYPVLVMLPALLAAFGTAPLLAGDLDSGSYKFLWTQALTPRRWLTVKMLWALVVAVLSAGLLTAGTWQWMALTERLGLAWNRFGAFPPTVFAYLVFASVLGLFTGLVLARPIAAAAAALGLFTLIRVSFELWLRPLLATPIARDGLVAAPNPYDWFIGLRYFDTAGNEVPRAVIESIQLSDPNPTAAFAAQHIRAVGYYVPWERFSAIQTIECGAVIALAFALTIGLTWWVDRVRS